MSKDGDPEPRAKKINQFVLVSFLGLLLTTTGCIKSRKQVLPEPQPAAGNTIKKDSFNVEPENGKKKIYLTFDDGPNTGTRVVMNILKEAQVPATFYMIGLHRYGSPMQAKLWEEVNAEPSFEVCNHSFSHGYHNNFAKFYTDVDGAVNDFISNDDSLKFNNTICRAPASNVWRLPGLREGHTYHNRTKVLDSLFKLGYLFTGWDWEWRYNGRSQKAIQTPDQLLKEMDSIFNMKLTRHKDHMILLAHDLVYADSADAAMLREFIFKLKDNPKYELRPISQYPGAGVAFHENATLAKKEQ